MKKNSKVFGFSPILLVVAFIALVAIYLVNRSSPQAINNAVDSSKEMRNLIKNVSDHIKQKDSSKFVVFQNGLNLITKDGNENGEIDKDLVDRIDGVAQESLYFGAGEYGKKTEKESTAKFLNFINLIKSTKGVFTINFTNNQSDIDFTYKRATEDNVINFTNDSKSYSPDNVPTYPFKLDQENSNNINTLKDVKNFLVLTNLEKFKTKEEFIAKMQSTNYDLLIIPSDFKGIYFTKSEVDSLKVKNNKATRLVLARVNLATVKDSDIYWQQAWNYQKPDFIMALISQSQYLVRFWGSDWKDIVIYNNDSVVNKALDINFNGVYLFNTEAYQLFF